MARQRVAKIDLSRIAFIDLENAVTEFKKLGRGKFLKKYGFSRSSKHYLLHKERLYDTKALVSAAYNHATGRRLANSAFSGGSQTLAVIKRIQRENNDFAKAEIFEDTLHELRHLAHEFDRLPDKIDRLEQLGFSEWIPLSKYKSLKTGRLPGIYVTARLARRPSRKIALDDARIVYVGETVSQTLKERLYQLNNGVRGKDGHSGGTTLWREKVEPKKLWLSIRSFSLPYTVRESLADSVRSSQIRFLERHILLAYVRRNENYPLGNSK